MMAEKKFEILVWDLNPRPLQSTQLRSTTSPLGKINIFMGMKILLLETHAVFACWVGRLVNQDVQLSEFCYTDVLL